MILVDSSVWIDFFRATDTPQSDRLASLLFSGQAVIGDLMIAEVLQGFDSDRDFATAAQLIDRIAQIDIAGREVAIQAARNYRTLRGMGITVRKTIDSLIATRCIMDGHQLLFSDRDFIPFVTHFGLRDAMVEPI
jgi:predicted nucleic acid-binding protein